MAGSGEEKAGWVSRVLGITVSAPEAGAGAGYSPVAIGKAALEWRTLCARSGGELEKLKQAIVTAYSGDEWDEDDTAEAVEKVEQLDVVLTRLDVNLADTVDDFLNAPAAAKEASAQAVLAEIDDYEAMISSDRLLAAVDDNEFLSTGIKTRALAALTALRGGFAKTG